MPIIDDFDDDAIVNTEREVSLASTKLVIGQHVQILAARLSMNMQVGRQDDELACTENLIEVLQKYHQILSAPEVVTETKLKRELAKIYDSSVLLSPNELAKQLEEIRSEGNIKLNPLSEDGMD